MAFNKEKVMDSARKFVDKGQVDKAIKEYLRVVKEDPQDVRVWLKIGDLYAKKGSKQEASETYLKVARYYQDQGFFLKAVAVYKQILKLDPRLVEVNLKLAELYRQLGLLSDAMQHFESVAAHFHREGKTKEALATVRQLVDLDPENIATRIKLAELYSKEGMTGEAVTEFGVACDQLRKQNRVDDFVKVAERLLWHKSDNLPLNRELAVLYLRRNDPRRALQKLQACFKADPRDVETLALLAQAFQALDQKSKTVSVLKELARVLDENKQRDKAEEVHRKILQFVPTDPDSLAYLGEKAPREGQRAGAKPGTPGPAPTPGPPATMPPPRGDRASGGQPRLNFTSEVAAIPEPRMTGAMPIVQPDFELPDYDEGASFSEDLSDEGSYGRGGSVAGEEHAEEIAKILTETDVYIKYGLHQKAIDHLRRVFALDPDNLEARERLKDVLVSQGREREAVAELMRLAEATAPHDPDRAEAYLRELLGLDGTHRPAFDLARRFKLDVTGASGVPSAAGSEGEIDLDSADLVSGQVAPIDDDLDFDDIDFSDPGSSGRRPPVGIGRADSFDGIDPAIFGGAGAASFARPSAVGDATRQVAASEVEALAAMSSAPRSLEFEDGVIETPPPPMMPGASWQPSSRSLDDVLDEQLDDALGEDIDQEVAAELSGANEFALPDDPDDAGEPVEMLPIHPIDDDLVESELPFDPAAAREFDAGIRRARTGEVEGDASPETFDPAAAAAFDADREDAYPYAPSAAELGAAPDDAFDAVGLGGAGVPAYDPPLAGVGDASATVDIGDPDELAARMDEAARAHATGELAGADSYDGAYTVDAPVELGEAPGYADGAGYAQDAAYADGAGYAQDAAYADGAGYAQDAAYADGGGYPQDPGYADGDAGYAAYGEPGGGAYASATVDAPYADDPYATAEPAAPYPAVEPAAPRAASALEDELDEVDFYVSQDMLVEASDLLRNLLDRYPGHPLIAAKLRDVEASAGGHVADGFARGPSVAEIGEESIEEELLADAVAADGAGTQNIDVDELEELEPEELDPDDLLSEPHELVDDEPAVVSSPAPRRAAKPAVVLEKPIDDSDAETHYDLGLAYKEMGLYDEAIKAFDKITSLARAVQCKLMIGLCRREQGSYSEAIHAFKAGLHADQVTEREKQSLYYEIGVTYEAMGDAREALYYFEMVVKRDPAFLDAAERAARLRGGAGGRRKAPDDASDAIDALLDEV